MPGARAGCAGGRVGGHRHTAALRSNACSEMEQGRKDVMEAGDEIEQLRAEIRDLRKALRMVGVVVAEALAVEPDEQTPVLRREPLVGVDRGRD